jgi:hypothetical protein
MNINLATVLTNNTIQGLLLMVIGIAVNVPSVYFGLTLVIVAIEW